MTRDTSLPRPFRRTPWLFAVAAILLLALTFWCARFVGIQDGQRDACEKIEQDNDLTAGPASLLPT